jgi:hypothetical protein
MRHRDTYLVLIAWLSFCLVTDPDVAKVGLLNCSGLIWSPLKEVFFTLDPPKSRFYPKLAMFFGKNGMVFLNGEQWSRHRKALNPIFSANSLKAYGTTLVDYSSDARTQVPADVRTLRETVL